MHSRDEKTRATPEYGAGLTTAIWRRTLRASLPMPCDAFRVIGAILLEFDWPGFCGYVFMHELPRPLRQARRLALAEDAVQNCPLIITLIKDDFQPGNFCKISSFTS